MLFISLYLSEAQIRKKKLEIQFLSRCYKTVLYDMFNA